MSLFYQVEKKYKKIIVNSLPGSINYKLNGKSHKGTPRCACLRASYTLEAAVILPFLACFFVSILLFFRVMQIELEVQKALDNTGRQMAVYAGVSNFANPVNIVNPVFAKGLFLKEISGSTAVKSFVTGKAAGISLMESDLSGDYIDLKAVYHIRVPIKLLGMRDIRVTQRAICRKWTGWHESADGDGEDIWVYITETGTVYHRDSSCSHLELSIKSVDCAQLEELRNENGGKYYACVLCTKEERKKRVFITNQGTCYHNDLNCSGIKRTVSMIRLSEVGERRECSRCGN